MLGEKSIGIMPVSRPSTEPGQDMDKWDKDRNRSACAAPERAFLDSDVCTRLFLPVTLEELLSGPIPEKQ